MFLQKITFVPASLDVGKKNTTPIQIPDVSTAQAGKQSNRSFVHDFEQFRKTTSSDGRL